MLAKVKLFIFSICVGICFLIKIDLVSDLSVLKITTLYETNFFALSVFTGFAFYFFSKHPFHKISKIKIFLSVLFSLFMLVGEGYASYGSYKLLFLNIATILLSLVKFVGYIYLFIHLFSLLDDLIDKSKNKELKFKNKYLSKYLELFNKYPFKVSFVTILIVLSIYMLAFYPIVLSPDPSFQIKMYFNEHTKYIDWVIQRDPEIFMTSHHPVFQTYMIGFCLSLGRFLVNDNFGLFLYTLIQSLIYSSVLAYTIKYMSNNGIKSKNRLIVLGMYLIIPMYLLYSMSAVKDTLYTAFMILFILKVFDIIKNYKEINLSYKYIAVLYFIMLFIGLFRHNGVYVIALTIFVLIFYTRKNALKILISFFAFFVSIYAFDKVLIPYLGISDGSAREMLSVPFQQTARLVSEKPDFYNEEDIKIIDYILKYDTLASRYNPDLADPVKNEYNKNTTKEDLKDYFYVWFKGLKKHPDIYVDATLNNTYGFFYPDKHNWYIYARYDKRVTDNGLVDYHYNKLSFLRAFIDGYANTVPYIPIIGAVSNIALNTWAVLILAAYLINTKNKRFLISLLPLFGSILFCFIGPANTYFRYTMPYIFALPVLTVLLLEYIRGEKVEKK
ncbi:MAG: hypothetical protein HFI73_04105 [Bacilli bacterium]|jgi:hypothetical protein|nr:hypothetical protein [Bacilli bacterium]